MIDFVTVEECLSFKNALFIDVRSPSEYKEATIVNAINFPILTDAERAEVGTVYRKESHQKAISLGVKFASYKLPQLYDRTQEYIKKYDQIVFFCWRGGMRSKSVCNFLSMLKVPHVYQLVGGYKAYRKYIMDYFENELDAFRFVMVHGHTGVGKTHILEQLALGGMGVLNLEELAQNSGSVFGDIVFSGDIPTQKMFESRIFHTFYYSPNKTIFVESESKRIGNVQIPEKIYQRMVGGYHVLIETTMENRIHTILQDYNCHLIESENEIKKALENLRKRLGNEAIDILLLKLSQKEYRFIVEYLFENYYDPLYQYSIEKYRDYDLIINYIQIEEAVNQLIEFANNLEKRKELSHK